jgi:hypothetical protein
MSGWHLQLAQPVAIKAALQQELGQEPSGHDDQACRRGHGDDSIYFGAANSRWTGAVSVGIARTAGTGSAQGERADQD